MRALGSGARAHSRETFCTTASSTATTASNSSVQTSQVAEGSARCSALPTSRRIRRAAQQRLADTAKRVKSAFPDNRHCHFRWAAGHGRNPNSLPHCCGWTSNSPPAGAEEHSGHPGRRRALARSAQAVWPPVPGFEGKIDDPRLRFVTTLFCYGCNLGPTQTARSLKDLSRKQGLAQFAPHDRGAAGKSLGAGHQRLQQVPPAQILGNDDGLRRRHPSGTCTSKICWPKAMRYRRYGGIGLLSTTVAWPYLHHFIPCGVYEAVSFSMGSSRTSPTCSPRDTVHGDTHAQSTPAARPMCWA